MLKTSDLEKGLIDLVKGYDSLKEAINNQKFLDFRDKSVGFYLGASFYTLFNFNKVRNYKELMIN